MNTSVMNTPQGLRAARCTARATRPSAGAAHGAPLVGRPAFRPRFRDVKFTLRSASAEVSESVGVEEAPRPASDGKKKKPYRATDLSYTEQYDEIYSKPLEISKPVPKPDPEAQARQPGAKRIPFSKDVWAVPKTRAFFNRKWEPKDIGYAVFMLAVHVGCLFAPMTFSWNMVWLFAATYFITGCLGITLTYHRLLAHKSFSLPKPLEYVLAYCGALAVQGDPLEWASTHRYHHLHTDTPLDPHSTYEGFWWSHMGWLLDDKATRERVADRSNSNDLLRQPFYTWLEKTYAWHIVGMFAALLAFGGFPALIWGGCLRVVWVYHITWFVNSATHAWGKQSYLTGDQARNNWWVGILAWGEGWHNNHHAFEYSARHGLEWWQLDITWLVIRGLQAVGLAKNVKLPTEASLQRIANPDYWGDRMPRVGA
ncbi:unnamed protein product [Pedinophyceae sp. YPF-701]|nr:unnamed protein product [Pedinophyceae sp. YPF-701]